MKYEITGIPWIKSKERDFDIAFQSFYMVGQDRKFFEKMGVDFEVKNHLAFSNGKLFYDERELTEAKKYLQDMADELPGFAKKMTDSFLAAAKNFEIFTNDFNNLKLENRTELLRTYEHYCSYILSLIPYSFIVSIILEEVAYRTAMKELESKSKNPALTWELLTAPTKRNKTNDAYQALSSIAEKYKRGELKDRDLHVYLEMFGWIDYYKPIDTVPSVETLTKRIKELASGLPITNKQEGQVVPRVENVSGFLQQLASVMKENVWARTYRREVMSYGFLKTRRMYQAISDILNTRLEDLQLIPFWEMTSILKNDLKVSTAELKKRKDKFVLVKLNGKTHLVSGSEADAYHITEKKIRSDTLQGKTAFPGIVEGIVQIIKTREELQTFRRDSILVCPTVGLWMTPAVEKCSAIVTDAGGILSHSAIVAREYKKPCIINTIQATTQLENGQKILVDATNGVVRIEKR